MSLRNLLSARADPLGWFASQAERGALVETRLGPTPLVVVGDASAVHELLAGHPDQLTKNTRGNRILAYVMGDSVISVAGGARWREKRRRMQPSFHRSLLPARSAQFLQIARAEVSELGPERFDLLQVMTRIAASCTGASLFSDDLQRHLDTLGPAMASMNTSYARLNSALLPAPEWMPGRAARSYRQARRTLRSIAMDVVDRHRGTDDLLTTLNEELPRERVLDEVVTLLLAGSETVAVAATWCAVALTGDAEARRRIRSEAAVDGPIAERTWLRWCVLEGLRLHPPAWVMVRRTTEEVALTAGTIPAGWLVFLPIRALQRSPRWFREPERYWPERWEEEPRPSAFFAFGDGSRRCLGESVALQTELAMLTAFFEQGDLVATTDEHAVSASLSTRPLAPVWSALRRARAAGGAGKGNGTGM